MESGFFNPVPSSLVSSAGAELIRRFFVNPTCGHLIELMHNNWLVPEYCWPGGKPGMRYYEVVAGGTMPICSSRATVLVLEFRNASSQSCCRVRLRPAQTP